MGLLFTDILGFRHNSRDGLEARLNGQSIFSPASPEPEPEPSGYTQDIISATGTNGTTSTNIANIYFRRSIMMWVYSAAEMQAAMGSSSGSISGLRFFINQQPLYQPLPAYAIGMKNGSFGSSSPGNTGYTIVKPQGDESFTVNTNKEFTFSSNFSWSGGDLAVIFAWGQVQPTWNASGQSAIGSGTMWYVWTDSAGTYVINTDNPTATRSWRPVLQFNRP
jgi:hypothetical protein